MNKKELIDEITRQVMAKLGEGGSDDAVATGAVTGSSSVDAARSAAGAESKSTEIDTSGPEILTPGELAEYIDHTLLKPEATPDQFDVLCTEAKEHHFYSVCVNSSWVPYCARKLQGSDVKVCAVVGFPLGAMSGRAKNFETRHAVEEGAREIDMVINVGALKAGDLKTVEEDIRWVRRACPRNVILKVIIETALLSDDEKVIACQLAKRADADFVKTSTGFSHHGATVQDVKLMRRTVGPKMGVKAAGGVRSFEDAVEMIAAGATRIGTSSGVKILAGRQADTAY